MMDPNTARAVLYSLYSTERQAVQDLSNRALDTRRGIRTPALNGARFVGTISDREIANHNKQVAKEEEMLQQANRNIPERCYRAIAALEKNEKKRQLLNEYFSQKLENSIHNKEPARVAFGQTFKLLGKLAHGTYRSIQEKALKHIPIYQGQIKQKRYEMEALERDLRQAMERQKEDIQSAVTEIKARLDLLKVSREAPATYNSCGREESRPNMLSKGAENCYQFTLNYLENALNNPNNLPSGREFQNAMAEAKKGGLDMETRLINLDLGGCISSCFRDYTEAKAKIEVLKASIAKLQGKILTLRGEPVSLDEYESEMLDTLNINSLNLGNNDSNNNNRY